MTDGDDIMDQVGAGGRNGLFIVGIIVYDRRYKM